MTIHQPNHICIQTSNCVGQHWSLCIQDHWAGSHLEWFLEDGFKL